MFSFYEDYSCVEDPFIYNACGDGYVDGYGLGSGDGGCLYGNMVGQLFFVDGTGNGWKG